MSTASWETCSAAVRAQVDAFLADTRATLAGDLVGVYLHGSLAMGCFSPAHSDIDLLVVTRQPMPALTRRRVAEHLLDRSRRPAPIEISYLTPAMLQPWRYPPPYDFHYSEMWRPDYERDLASGAWEGWDTAPRHDPDLAAHVTVLRRRGVVLHGPPIAGLFPEIPPADYIASILADVRGALDSLVEEPVYGILNACRTLAYLATGQVLSKDEGGRWALGELPEPLRPPVEQARASYAGEAHAGPFDPAALARFREYARRELRRLVP